MSQGCDMSSVCPDPNSWLSKGYALTNGMVYIFWPLLMLSQLVWL